MKNVIALVFITTSLVSNSQNLVPNGSFETYTICPNSASQVYYAVPWTGKDNNSVDYFNSCSPTRNVPYSGSGFQYAKEGVAYSALWFLNGFGNDYREYLQVGLTSQLTNTKYYLLKFYTNNYITKYAVNNIGAALTASAIGASGGSGSVINITPSVVKFGNPIINDTLNWIEVSGIIQANGTEQFLTIGNFNDDNSTDTLSVNYSSYPGAYYYIDDVSLTNIITPQWQYRDTTIYLADSVLIGPAITGLNVDWFDMSNAFIKNAPGIYVKPIVTTPYKATETFNSVVYNHTVTVTVLLPSKVDEYDKLQKSVTIFPNPNNGNVSLQFAELTKGNVDVTISDVTGKIVYQNKLQVTNALKNFDIDVKSGIYFVKIHDSSLNKTLIKKLVVQQ
ncbi:MAG: T9SS type A sorting domain-containing protein [Bacteroidetes bacterium]|nr:T9SS type A sorting domain-containing protein [Bacteroidota bacterium]